MPKHFAPEIKTRALELYIQGDQSAREITEQLFDEFVTEVKPSTIYLWARQEGWGDVANEVKADAIQQVKESSSQRMARVQEEHLDQYEGLRQKAGSALEVLPFDKAFDAAKALDMSIKGERTVMEGMINLQFVQNVLAVLVEEVSDDALLSKIANRLRGLIQTNKEPM